MKPGKPVKKAPLKKKKRASLVIAKDKKGRLAQALRLVKKRDEVSFRLGVSLLLEFPAEAFKHFSRMVNSKLAFRRAAGVFGLGSLEHYRRPEIVLKAFKDKDKRVREEAYSAASKLVVEEMDVKARARLLQALLESEFIEDSMRATLKKKFPATLAVITAAQKKK
jgi:hypothetical protein